MRNKKIIFIDLDGTIFDVSERSYQVYKEILQKYNKKNLSKENYLRLKREKIPIQEILKKTKAEDIFLKFKRDWKKEIETPHYLVLDKVSSLKKRILLNLKNHYQLVLVTLRNHPRNLFRQLKKKKIDKIFDEILVSANHSQNEKWKIKSKLLKRYQKFFKNSILIGDTETDILAGKHLGIKTIAMTQGMRSKKFLKKYRPDILIKNFSEIKNILENEH